jgi:3-oxoacyl-[acyl-carrier-protein] synthase II
MIISHKVTSRTDTFQNIIPPTLNLYNPSPGFNFNYAPLQAQEKLINVALSNSFGFGGTNACLAFAKEGYKV